MKVGDKIIIKKSISLRNVNGTIVSSIPGKPPKAYVVKAHSAETVFFVLKESEFSRVEGQENVNILGDYFFIEQGSDGKVVNVLPHSRYLCEFESPFYNIAHDPKIGFRPIRKLPLDRKEEGTQRRQAAETQKKKMFPISLRLCDFASLRFSAAQQQLG